MAALSLDNGILWIRQLCQITNTTFVGATDTQIARNVNFWYRWLYKLREQRAPVSSDLITATVSGTAIYTSEAAFTHPEILGVERVVSGQPPVQLERMEWNELRGLQNYDQATGLPLRYAAYKLSSAETWRVALHPIPNGAYQIQAYHRVYPTALSGTNVPVLGDAEGDWLYLLAAATTAAGIGRSDLIEQIMGPVPETLRKAAMVEGKRHDPKQRPGEEAMVVS